MNNDDLQRWLSVAIVCGCLLACTQSIVWRLGRLHNLLDDGVTVTRENERWQELMLNAHQRAYDQFDRAFGNIGPGDVVRPGWKPRPLGEPSVGGAQPDEPDDPGPAPDSGDDE